MNLPSIRFSLSEVRNPSTSVPVGLDTFDGGGIFEVFLKVERFETFTTR